MPPPVSLAESARLLDATRPWVRLVGIVLFVTAGILILAGLAVAVAGAGLGQLASVSLGLLYAVMSVLYIVPGLYLVRYAARIREFVSQGQRAVQLESALETQRAFWKFIGVMTAIGIVVSVVGVVAAIAIPSFLAARGAVRP
jgi:hypothetical protein